MKAKALLAGLCVVSACAQSSFYDSDLGYAEAAWARTFAAIGCSQPVAGLVERIATHPDFVGNGGWGRYDGNSSGSAGRANYLQIVSGAYYREAVEIGVVVLSNNGTQANLTVQGCTL